MSQDRKKNAWDAREEHLSEARPPPPLGAGPKVGVVIVPLITFLLFFSLQMTQAADVKCHHGLGNRLAAQLAATCGLPMGSHMEQRPKHFESGRVGPVWIICIVPHNKGLKADGHSDPKLECRKYPMDRTALIVPDLERPNINLHDLTGRVRPARLVRLQQTSSLTGRVRPARLAGDIIKIGMTGRVRPARLATSNNKKNEIRIYKNMSNLRSIYKSNGCKKNKLNLKRFMRSKSVKKMNIYKNRNKLMKSHFLI